jgi:thiol-disulfide isomerase/thioredoxin
MNWAVSLVIVLGLVALATLLGVLWRARTGRVRTVTAASDNAEIVRPGDVGVSTPFGSGATLLQFSTEFCAPCRSTNVLLTELAKNRPEVAHVEIDLTNRPDLARRFNVMQTPTTLILDGSGVVRARIGGAPRSHDLHLKLDSITGSANVQFS